MPPTWEAFKRAVRKVDRDSLLVEAAAATALIAQAGLPPEAARFGMTPWNIADVARTALAWGGFNRPEANAKTLLQLCNLDAQLVDEDTSDDSARLARVLTRIMFEQFSGQRSEMPEVARTILLFGSAAEHPQGFAPEAMTPGWFEAILDGVTVDEYVEAIFVVSAVAMQREGRFSPEQLDLPDFKELDDVFSRAGVRAVFEKCLVTSVGEFKRANRAFQDRLPAPLRKYAFNPLAQTPFIEGIADVPIAPWGQAVIRKALPPAVYHLALPVFGESFTRDLGGVFQHYTGRQLELVRGVREVLPEVRYGTKRDRRDSCDWFLDLPEMTVLIECKARQPIESLRVGGPDWLSSVEGSIGKGINQLNRSNTDFPRIALEQPSLDPAKPRVGLVVTLEPFYVNQNWMMWDYLPKADLPISVVSIRELEQLVLLDADEMTLTLKEAAAAAGQHNAMLLDAAASNLVGRENPLLGSTFESFGLFDRADAAARRLAVDVHPS